MTRCAVCRQPGPDLCRSCRFSLASTRRVSDPGSPVVAAMPFEGAARTALLSFKYRNRRGLARHLAHFMVRRLGLGQPDSPRFDVVTWAPTSAARLADRGFDQAELLARAIGRELGVPCRRLLYRSHAAPQTGSTRAQRLAGPTFRSRRTGRALRVLVVDDVVTTGATLQAAAAALRAVGIADVRLVAAAATPAHIGDVRPTRLRTVATAASGSSSTIRPIMPTELAASTLVATSSKNAVRPGSAPSLAKAS